MVNCDSGMKTTEYGATIYHVNFETDDERLFSIVRNVVSLANDNDVLTRLYLDNYEKLEIKNDD